MEPFRYINLTVYQDGTVHRAPHDPPPVPACPSPPAQQVATDDVTLNEAHGTSLRLFKPPSSRKLPILLHFHGGAFLSGSCSLPADHSFLCKLAAHSQTLIVAVNYRLAPENPLPAAYDDCIEALLWLRKSPHPWLTRYADFSNCFLAGDSAGANIVHHVAMWTAGREKGSLDLGFGAKIATCVQDMEGICVRGAILAHPVFTCGADPMPENRFDIWKLAGVNAEHPFANPLCSSAPLLADAALPRILVAVASKDIFASIGLAYHNGLIQAGKEAKLFISQDEDHVFHLLRPDSENVPPFLDELHAFINCQ